MIIHCKLRFVKGGEIKFCIMDNDVNKFSLEEKEMLEKVINDRMSDDIVKNVYPNFKIRLIKKAYNIYRFNVTHAITKDDLIEAVEYEELKIQERYKQKELEFRKAEKKIWEEFSALECVKKSEEFSKKETLTEEEFIEARKNTDEFAKNLRKAEEKIRNIKTKIFSAA